ncbi:hypothetical protein [Catenovulum maritimum]|uniref:Right handed beta helix domain-containing protein n=1 Tax=Catenovulum maritimum TaxID=1513271 RepID=A0A0J8GVD8_9ALTE|nr:hypothetical protein [Catenovulum maritimum]KMT64638.1 hypothetical protein XM47_13440 [Catenovulum maritimum]
MKFKWVIALTILIMGLIYKTITPPEFLYLLNIKIQQLIQQKSQILPVSATTLANLSSTILPEISTIDTKVHINDWHTKNAPLIQHYHPLNQVLVSDSQSLSDALSKLKPNTMLSLNGGVYQIKRNKIKIDANSSLSQPIVITAVNNKRVIIEFFGNEGLWINAPYVQISGIQFEGKCELDSQCEHAIHIVGKSDHLIISNNIFNNFNAHIKSNGIKTPNGVRFPNHVTLSHNQFINHWPRKTASPVTPIDIVGGEHWQIDGNLIADFAKLEGNGISYGAFLKGGGQNGQFSNNLVICEMHIKHKTKLDVRIGLSFGGGGTAHKNCVNEKCTFEHKNGTLINNKIVNCPNSAGIYLNNSININMYNNQLISTLGVDTN